MALFHQIYGSIRPDSEARPVNGETNWAHTGQTFNSQEEVPEWLKVMYNTVYFEACTTHRHEKKDQFCIDCCISLCSNCLPIHNHRFNPPHKIVKIRRYVYCEVIKRQDLSKHFNCSGIQVFAKEKTIQVKDEGLNNSNEGSTVSSLKRQRSRKGVPLRAPMF
ncbi:hypothetical protein LguiB_025257 [Lonicera macranthoides]